ncbi:hypothetical protein C1645_821177 [Glomus cerebriforme]|uniref:Uncharacterized protein n=1 Tax=Glomus cerebriforme TaxID=658196 RepID=A0A397T785_9GLOM|nr:hypothetical protein C1645_821177 [Glomus cerebriforme]
MPIVGTILLDFFNTPVPYYQGFKAKDIGACLYKICDNSVRPRNFLGTDNEDEIETILTDRKGHSLHEFIDDDELLHPIIDFNLPVKILNAITPKLLNKHMKNLLYYVFRNTCLEISPK